jgi:hypothetical protein
MARQNTVTTFVGLLTCTIFSHAAAHHSISANFDPNRQIEIRGTVVEFRLQSPHSSLVVDGVAYIDGAQASEAPERWEIESRAANFMRSEGYREDSIRPGDRIVVTGMPHRRGLKRANSAQFQRDDGSSYASVPAVNTTFHPQLRAGSGLGAAEPIAVNADGVFRVAGRWQPPFQQEGTESVLPLNEAGLAARRGYDQSQSPANTCEPLSIPEVFHSPRYFVDIEINAAEAVVRNQAYDIVRTIPLDGGSAPADSKGQFGVVSGRVEGETLVVESRGYPASKWGLGAATQVNGGGADVPSSVQKSVTEWFSVSADAQALTYRYTLFDPVYMSQPHTASIELARVPQDVPMYPYDCNRNAASMFSRPPGASVLEATD